MRYRSLFSSPICFFAVICASLCAVPCVIADPSAEQQYWLELINQARRDPASELGRLVNYATPTTFASPASNNPDVAAALAFYGTSASDLAAQWSSLTAAPPLAWNDSLHSSATTYSNLMVSMDKQSHSLDGLTLDQRVTNAGFSANFLDVGENLYASAKSTVHGHSGFLIDWGDSDNNPANGFGNGIQSEDLNGVPTVAPHRVVTMDPHFKQIGIANVTTGIPGSNVNATGPVVVTQHLANTFRQTTGIYFSDAILTGVVYADNVQANNFYTPGEGIAGTTVEVFNNLTNSLIFSGVTNNAGGFNIPLLGVSQGEVLRISALGLGLPDLLTTVTGFTEPPATYGAPVTFTNNIYAPFQVVPEPGAIQLACAAIAALRCRRRRQKISSFDANDSGGV